VKIPKKIWLVSQDGVVDFVAVDLKTAREMATNHYPHDGDVEFKIQRWVLRKDRFEFDGEVRT
jgi:hypothetical protein